jgi:RNA polymerase sigma factor (sigma-70 family)
MTDVLRHGATHMDVHPVLGRMRSASDEVVIAGMAAGDTDAAGELIRRYQRRVYGLAVTILGPGPEAEDASQETFLRVWRHAEAYDARRASVSTWLLSIAHNAAIDMARLRRFDPVDPHTIIGFGVAERTTGPEDAAVMATEIARVRKVLGQLPGPQCDALLASAVYGRTAVEIAKAQGVPLGTAKSRIRAGLRHTRDLLRSHEVAG